MYAAIILVFIAAAIGLIGLGAAKRKVIPAVVGILVGLGLMVLLGLMSFWGEMLWFESVGFGRRFWRMIAAQVLSVIAGVGIGAVVPFLLTWSLRRYSPGLRIAAIVLGVIIGGQWGAASWRTIVKWLYGVSTGVTDPVLGRDVGFYLFSLPLYDTVYSLLLGLAVVSLIATLLSLFVRVRSGNITLRVPGRDDPGRPTGAHSLFLSAAVLVGLLAVGRLLSRYHLMYSEWGVVLGPGWTDVHVRLPGYWIVAVLMGLLALTILVPHLRRRLLTGVAARFTHGEAREQAPAVSALATAAGVVIAAWLIVLAIAPALVQWLRVEPNEVTFEEPYIANNIEFTRRAFGLDKAEQRQFPASEEFTREMVQQNQSVLNNVRLWDWRALDAVYKQFQELRLYYEFTDVDVDRYHIGDDYRQVMVSAREMNVSRLPAQSQTFINRHFKYTHGYGITMTPVSKFTASGLPELLIRDIPPKSTHESLEVERPELYYGELTDTYAVVNTSQEEFDYPSGEKNVYARYGGTGGVRMGSLWRRLVYGWMFGGTRLFLSSYPTDETRIMFRRNIRERVRKLAPFLEFDDDPYVVLADGKLYWMVDAYTTSRRYPYSEEFEATEIIEGRNGRQTRAVRVVDHLDGVNYIRNSVKVVVDAYNGSVDFYVIDEEDPIARMWWNFFPDLFTDGDEMPQALRDHIRYPSDLLLVQGLVYAKYHMTDPMVFYNQEDLWVRATEKYYQNTQPVSPYYIMWEPPASDAQEFIQMLPFTPKNRQVLIGWVAGMCDDENYGRFLAYKFPKEKRILGPQQVESKIDQNAFLSRRLTLWDQRGSNVIRGNVLAIPIEDTLLYVEPIYLQAEAAAYPELRLVVVMHGDNISYAETFDKALRGLFEDVAPAIATRPGPTTRPAVPGPAPPGYERLVNRANRAFEDYLRLTGERQFSEASDALDRLEQSLQQLQQHSGPAEPNQPAEDDLD